MSRLAAIVALLAAILATAQAQAASNGLVISQVYGGGGSINSPTYERDYVELFNRGPDPVGTEGMAVQYAAATGTTWQSVPLGTHTVQPGRYLLVGMATGGTGGAPLPTPDASGFIAISSLTGRVALASQTTPLACAGACAGAPWVVDLLAYGPTATDAETSPAPVLTASTAAFRGSGGCVDTDNNSSDVTAATPAPRTSATPAAPCANPQRFDEFLLVSRDGPGGAGGTGRSGGGETTFGSLAPGGGVAAFSTRATNLRPPGFAPATDLADILLRDLGAGTNEIVSLPDGPPPDPLEGPLGDGEALAPAVSADGNRIAFLDDAPDLRPTLIPRSFQVWVRDRQEQTTKLASRTGAAPADAAVAEQALSADGTTVAFTSAAQNLDPDADGRYDVFVHDLGTGTTTLASTAFAGIGTEPVLSADGDLVAFTASEGCPLCDFYTPPHVVVRSGGTLSEIGLASDETPANGITYAPSVSATGRFVTFLTTSTNLGGVNDGKINVFLRDRVAGVTYPVTPGAEGADEAAVSPDGSVVVFREGAGLFARNIHDGTLDVVTDKAAALLGVATGADPILFSTADRTIAPGADPANDLDVVAGLSVGAVPANTDPPDVAGVVQISQPLTCQEGRWTERPNDFDYEWLLDGTPIGGATSRVHTPAPEAEGHAIACRVIAKNAAGDSAPATSVDYVVAAALPIVVTPPGLTGVPQPGQTLTCVPGSFSGDVDSIAYRWLRSSGGGPFVAIDGATGTDYVVQEADIGSAVGCEAIATNDFGSRSARSPVKTAAAGTPISSGPPAITGTAAVGSQLTCTTGTWANQPLRFTYRWLRDGAEIAGQTDAAFTPTATDRERRVSCEVTASNDVGTGAPATSGAVFVAGAVPSNTALPVLVLTKVGARPTDYRATCQPGTWRDAPGDFAYAFLYSSGEPLGTGEAYDIRAADLGRELVCKATATNALGTASAFSKPVAVPLPPADPSLRASLYKAGGYNEFDPVNFLPIAPGSQAQLEAQQKQRVQAAFTAFFTSCATRSLEPGLPTEDPRTIVNTAIRERELCRLVLNTPASQFVIAADGVKIVADPSKCLLGSDDPCARLPIPMPAATLPAPGIDPGVQAERILWDFDTDGVLDASCASTAPVVRTIFARGNYNVRAILVLPDSEVTGQYPSVTMTYRHFPSGTVPTGLAVPYTPGSGTQVSFPTGRQGPLTPPTNLPTTPSLALGKLRGAQPFACKGQLAPPAQVSQPCVTEGYAGRVHVRGNLCPISLRRIPQNEVQALKTSDPDVYDLLVAQNDALGADRRVGAVTSQFGSSPAGAAQQSLAQFAAATPSRFRVTSQVAGLLDRRARAAHALDQIYIARGTVNVNGVDVKPADDTAVVLVPSDAGETLDAVKKMVVSASKSALGLGEIPLSKGSERFKADLVDRVTEAAAPFQQLDLDELAAAAKRKLDLGPFNLAGDATVSLVDNAAIIDAQAELPALTTAPGSSAIRVGARIRATADGKVELEGLRLRAGLAYLGGIKVQDLDLVYDGGLSVTGKLLFPPLDTGIEIEEFRIDREGALQALVLNYLAGAGQGIPVGPGVFLTKVGGGLTLDPDEVRANAAVSVGPSAGGGCPVVGADGTMTVHFAPAPFSVAANVDLGLVCLRLANVDFLARSDGYVTVQGSMGFEGGPLYFNAAMRGSVLLPAWQVKGSGSGGIRDVLSGSVQAVVSRRGLAGCGTIDLELTELSGGAGVRFTPTILAGPLGILSNVRLFTGCDLSPFETVVPPPGARLAQNGAQVVQVPAGTPVLALSAEGVGAAPRVVLRNPGGDVVADLSGAAATVDGGPVLALRVEDEDRTVFLVGKPAVGRWRVEPAADSVPIARLQRAAKLPAPSVHARVTGHGAQRVLHYRVDRARGQVVRFVEEAPGGGQLIGKAVRGGRGTIRFTVADARGTRRRIVAQIEQDGLPRDNLVVARFAAPSPRVGRPRRVRLSRQGRITWRPAPFATGYEVVVTRADGSRRLIATGKRRSLRVKGALRARVTALGANGRRGKPVTVRRPGR